MQVLLVLKGGQGKDKREDEDFGYDGKGIAQREHHSLVTDSCSKNP